MNIRKSLILSLTVAAFAVPGISSAATAYNTGAMSYKENSQNSKTRAEVIRELEASRKDGTFENNVSREYPKTQQSLGSEKTRVQVLSELKAARLNGTFDSNIEKNYGMAQKFSSTSDTRIQVKQNLAIARADGQIQDNISRN
ncbi:hypothetical protein HC248_03154 [Polaromonas vacuolata]|uniref:DUF4148 domain-containing protein n=1 Tax=Polaromonas vacuolata TaxID=37448 RepID=A0A6H2HDF6_9BURK|nr:DUF4148 domain-containing protein [Polaromonas vacuolata]QJC57823.1 hypothetical protein HC248_03154 [Polaromonas vacuolata]